METNDSGDHLKNNEDFNAQLRQLGTPIQCQHCYCGRTTINGKEHLVCCMCGHRTLVNPISY